MSTTDAEKYNLRGVSASKHEVHEAIKNLDKGLFPTAFCKILPDFAAHNPDFCNIMHADTAGTKTSLAYLYWRETGDVSVWEGIVQDALVMNLDDMACVGCIDDIVISSTIGRNKNLITGEVIKTLIDATVNFAEKMRQFGINLHLAGGETADVGDIVRTADVGFTAFGRMKKSELIVNQIKAGDCIVGFSSYGKASYENTYNGGMGSNGLTSARHDVLKNDYAAKYPESFDPNTPPPVVYVGNRDLTEKITVDGHATTIGKLLLSPTRTYLPLLKAIFDQIDRAELNGIIHCTGGGQTKVTKYANNCHIVKNNWLPTPPLFQLIQAESKTDWREMYQVFNMGHRLEIYTNAQTAEKLIHIAQQFNIEAQIVGHVEKLQPYLGGANQNIQLTLETPYGNFQY